MHHIAIPLWHIGPDEAEHVHNCFQESTARARMASVSLAGTSSVLRQEYDDSGALRCAGITQAIHPHRSVQVQDTHAGKA